MVVRGDCEHRTDVWRPEVAAHTILVLSRFPITMLSIEVTRPGQTVPCKRRKITSLRLRWEAFWRLAVDFDLLSSLSYVAQLKCDAGAFVNHVWPPFQRVPAMLTGCVAGNAARGGSARCWLLLVGSLSRRRPNRTSGRWRRMTAHRSTRSSGQQLLCDAMARPQTAEPREVAAGGTDARDGVRDDKVPGDFRRAARSTEPREPREPPD